MPEAARAEKPSLRVLYGLAATAIVVAGLHAGARVLVPLALSLFLSILARPLLQLLGRRLPTGLAVLGTMLVACAVGALFLVLLLGSLGEFRAVGPHYVRALEERISYTVEWWQQKGVALGDWLPERLRRPEALAELVGSTIAGAIRVLSDLTIVLLTLVFLLFEMAALPRKLERLPPALRATLGNLGQVSDELQRYLAIKTLMAALIGVATTLWLALLGIDFPVLCGLLAFACHFVPNVGAAFAAVPALLLAFVQYDPSKVLVVGLGYLVIGLSLGNLAEPALLGRRLNLSPLVVFVSLVLWGWVWGPIGMFLSVPLTMAIKISLERSADWRWLATLLDAGGRGSAELARTEEPEPASGPQASGAGGST